jgi:hypothetical protein
MKKKMEKNMRKKERKVKLLSFSVVGLEVLTAVVMKSILFWDRTPCSPLRINRCFGEIITSIFRAEK